VASAGNVKDMFQQIVAMGSDIETRVNIHSVWVLIERMTVAGS
ncbi:metallopeptidase TldD-related protein, partial [Pseudomonas soli]